MQFIDEQGRGAYPGVFLMAVSSPRQGAVHLYNVLLLHRRCTAVMQDCSFVESASPCVHLVSWNDSNEDARHMHHVSRKLSKAVCKLCNYLVEATCLIFEVN